MILRVVQNTLYPLFAPRIASVEGLENIPKGPFLIAANHIDFLDGFFISCALLKRATGNIKFLSITANYWWTGGATIPVAKNNKAKSLDTAARALTRGDIICIFPEGHRNTSSVIGACKSGIVRLAVRSGMPVVPIGILGSAGNTMWQSVTNTFVKKENVTLRIGAPIILEQQDATNLSDETIAVHTGTIMRAVAALCTKTYQP